jgi:hypothetical protein
MGLSGVAVALPWIRGRAASDIDFRRVVSFKAPQPNCTQSSSLQVGTDRTGIEFAPREREIEKTRYSEASILFVPYLRMLSVIRL